MAEVPSSVLNGAVQFCIDAYRKTQDAEHAKKASDYEAKQRAGRAYAVAMPRLSSQTNIRAFIACVTYGMLIEAFRYDQGTKLLYAAQIALRALPREVREPRSAGRQAAAEPATAPAPAPAPTPATTPTPAPSNPAPTNPAPTNPGPSSDSAPPSQPPAPAPKPADPAQAPAASANAPTCRTRSAARSETGVSWEQSVQAGVVTGGSASAHISTHTARIVPLGQRRVQASR